VRGQDADGITFRGTVREGVARDLLAGHAVEEERGRARRQPYHEPARGVEQGTHRVEVAVGRGAAGAPGGGGRLPLVGQAGRIPHRPEHVVGVAVLRGLAGQCQQAGHPVRGVRGGATEQGQLARVGQDGGQRLGRRVLTGFAGGRTKCPAEPSQPQGIRAAELAGQQFYRRLLVQGVRVQGAAQQQQQRSHAGLGFQRQLITGDDRGTPVAASARRSNGTWPMTDLTRTAIDDQGTPSCRWARRSASATTVASWLALEAMTTRSVPAGTEGSGRRSRWPPGGRALPGGRDAGTVAGWPGAAGSPPAGSRAGGRRAAGTAAGGAGSLAAIRRDAASRAGPLRRQVPSAMIRAGWSSGVRNRSGNRMIALTSAPRNA
jgi:hypothetical protein